MELAASRVDRAPPPLVRSCWPEPATSCWPVVELDAGCEDLSGPGREAGQVCGAIPN